MLMVKSQGQNSIQAIRLEFLGSYTSPDVREPEEQQYQLVRPYLSKNLARN